MQDNILEFVYYPNNFPSITSYYLLDNEKISKFEFDYKDLQINPIINFMQNEDLNDDNSSYHIYNNNESEHYKKIHDLILISQPGINCDLLEHFYKLQNNPKPYELKIITNDNNLDTDDSNESLYRQSDNIINVVNIYNNRDNDINATDKINNIIKNNNKIICDNEVKEILLSINSNI